MDFDFTTPKDNSVGQSAKWHALDKLTGGPTDQPPLPMWVAQMDFAPAPVLLEAAQAQLATGEFGYFAGMDDFCDSICWWQDTRHGWRPDPAHILATHGLGNAIGLTLQALTEPGDGVIIFTPVYHEFTNKIARNGRTPVESPLRIDAGGLFRMDLAALETQLTGTEAAVLISSPHNPAGRVWDAAELQALADFCLRHDLLLISDEIHQDIVYPGQKHLPTALAAPQIAPKLVAMSAASKTFDIAGLRTGYVVIPDDDLRARFAKLHRALDIQPNRSGVDLTMAAYSPDGAAWVDALIAVLDRNRQAFCDGIDAIPGVSAMPMQGTFLAWVDFSGTGMSQAEINTRITRRASVIPTPGPSLGTGGALHGRFNIGTTPNRVAAAVSRLQDAFADLQ